MGKKLIISSSNKRKTPLNALNKTDYSRLELKKFWEASKKQIDV